MINNDLHKQWKPISISHYGAWPRWPEQDVIENVMYSDWASSLQKAGEASRYGQALSFPKEHSINAVTWSENTGATVTIKNINFSVIGKCYHVNINAFQLWKIALCNYYCSCHFVQFLTPTFWQLSRLKCSMYEKAFQSDAGVNIKS